MSDILEGFILKKIVDTGYDGFPGTRIEIGKWDGKDVAVKFGFKNLHKKEAMAIAKIGEHPNIVQLMKPYKDGDGYIVLEAVGSGETLEHVFNKNVKIPFEKCIDWLLQLAKAIKHIHDNGFIHHDIKDSNILIDDSKDILKICDFELSVESSTGIKFNGSSKWMAPELLDENEKFVISNKIDVFAFGLIFIKLIFCGRDTNIVKYMCPITIFDFMYSCVERDPDKRPTINEAISLLSKYPHYGPSLIETLLNEREREDFKDSFR